MSLPLYRVGSHTYPHDKPVPASEEEIKKARQQIEPWLAAVFQSEHLNLLVGNGLTVAVSDLAGQAGTILTMRDFGTKYDDPIKAHAEKSAETCGRGDANFEDQLRSALALLEGMRVAAAQDQVTTLQQAIDTCLKELLDSVIETECRIENALPDARNKAENYLISFLMSFASRAASRERLHVFTTNYDRLIEHGCDLAGLRMVDRFVGALNPVFRSSRVEVDMHYNPPGIRGEPRFLEGVIRLTKLHGSLDWCFDHETRTISKQGIPFGANSDHRQLPSSPLETVMIYPNPAKDMETLGFPYAELFRDFAAALCRPNSVLVTYGYSFGDDHINRVLLDMLTIPSTHLVIILYGDVGNRAESFCDKAGRPAQISLLTGGHFGSLETLINHYLPKSAIDSITARQTELLSRRGAGAHHEESGPAAGTR